MKNIKEVYPDKEEPFYGPADYRPLLESFEYKIVVQVDEDNWQGDSWILFQNFDKYGYLQFGWGSCSGCDALQACENYEDLEKLRNELHQSIQWFDNLDSLKEFMNNHDWEADYSGRSSDCKKFIKEVLNL